jgi:hypothetical protein
MKSTIYISILFLITILSCKTQSRKGLQLIDATQKSWAGGTPQSGSGNKINLLLQLSTQKKVVVEHLWIDGKEVDFEIQNYRMILDRTATKGDTIDLSYSQIFKENENILNIKQNGIKCPFEEYKIVVAFDVNGKKRFLKTNEVNILPKVSYP